MTNEEYQYETNEVELAFMNDEYAYNTALTLTGQKLRSHIHVQIRVMMGRCKHLEGQLFDSRKVRFVQLCEELMAYFKKEAEHASVRDT